MADQFIVKSYARGVKLTIQHFYDPANDLAAALGNADVLGQPMRGKFSQSWNLSPQSQAFKWPAYDEASPGNTLSTGAAITLPMLFPPPQGEFNAQTLAFTEQPTLLEMSIAWDQRASQNAIADDWAFETPTYNAAAASGQFCPADMARYTFRLNLVEKVPTILDVDGDSETFRIVLSLDFPGQALFGNPGFNPYLVDGIGLALNPYKVYYWQFRCPGLGQNPDGTTVDNATTFLLGMPSFTVLCNFGYPIGRRDYSASTSDPAEIPYVQNIPTNNLGIKNTKAFHITPSVADATITGDDVQTAVNQLEAPFLDRLRAGYGRQPGSESDLLPWEQLALDTGYQAMTVPLFPNWWNVRAGDIDADDPKFPKGAGFPYIDYDSEPPYTNAVCEQRFVRVPTGFVVHHVFACWNLFPYASEMNFRGGGHGFVADYNSSDTFVQKVGVAMCTAPRADNLAWQQVAYLEFDPTNFDLWLVDLFRPGTIVGAIGPVEAKAPSMAILGVPLVWSDEPILDVSYVPTGRPVFMGAGNSTTQERSYIGSGSLPFTEPTFGPPTTNGGEQLLCVRWSMQDAAKGLDDPDHLADVRLGWGGNHVIIIGKQSLVDAGDDNQSANIATGQI